MKVSLVIDSNVWVSAFLSRQGKPADILRLAAEHKLGLLISPAIWEEVVDVLHRPHILGDLNVNIEELTGWLASVRDLARWMPGKITVEAVVADPDDNIILGCALEGRADYIVTGDRHLRSIKTYSGIPHPLTCGVLGAVEEQ